MAKRLDSRLTPSRKTVAGLVVACGVLALIEGAALIADAHYGFHARLVAALDSIERQTGPTPPRPLPWPPHTVLVRVPDQGQDPNEVYTVGGRRIPGGHRTGLQGSLSPGQLANDPRKRIFVVGESVAFGYPYEMQYWFGQIIQERLQDKYIVFNAGQISWSSSDLLPLVQRIVDEYRPAILILFLGNNEWQHWNGSGQVARVNRFVRVFRFFGHSRFFSSIILQSLKYSVVHRNQGTATNDFQFEHELQGYRYALEHPAERYFSPDTRGWLQTRQAFVANFARNVSEMIECAQRKNVRVILMSPPINYRLSPAWTHPQPESFDPATRSRTDALLHEAVQLLARPDAPAALAAIDRAIALDPLPPIFHYLRGEILTQLDRRSEAERAYLQSRENMVGHLGSPLSFRRVMDQLRQQTGVDFIDTQELFDRYEHAIGGSFNEHLVLDDCHPTPLGQRVIADALQRLLQ